MIPILYPNGETEFNSNGLGRLVDCISCEVTEERNGKYELTLTYPSSGNHADDIVPRRIILASPNGTSRSQPFDISQVVRTEDGLITVTAEHVSYRLKGSIVIGKPSSPFTYTSAADAFAAIDGRTPYIPAGGHCPTGFLYDTDVETKGTVTLDKCKTARDFLLGSEGSVLDIFGGEYEWDRFNVYLHSARGEDRGVTVRSGKNITKMEYTADAADVYNGALTVYGSGDNYVRSYNTDYNDGYITYPYFELLDVTQRYSSKPGSATLNTLNTSLKGTAEYHRSYVATYEIGIAGLDADIAEQIDRVSLCDTVTVYDDIIGVNLKTKVTKTIYDVSEDRYKEVTLGTVRKTVADLLAEMM